MSPHLRKEKNCLNCGAFVEERYCTRCGQENVEIKESFGHLISHFISDLTHYDSKFLTTLKDLLIKPGFLTREYLAGKRAKYLHPIRMYVFVSFLYFLITLSFNDHEKQTEEAIAKTAAQNTRKQIIDSIRIMQSGGYGNPANAKIRDSVIKNILTRIDTNSVPDKDMIFFLNTSFRDLVAFDSSQRLLPEQKREKGLTPWLYRHWMNTVNLYGKNGTHDLILSRTAHFVPKMMFFLLPLFALLLKLFYDKKKYFYTDHLIFSLHFHTAVFLLFLIFSAENIQFLLAPVYLGLALRKTYGQSAFITVIKVIGLTVLYSIFILTGYFVLAVSALL
jgi:hypothetical protein